MSHCVEKPKRQRRWAFTVNNYTEKDVDVIRSWNKSAKYLIFGKEKAPKTGTPHLQGYVHFINAKCFSSMKKKIPTIHLEVAKGNDAQNKDYCSKDMIFEEYGEPTKQGKRTDIDLVKQMIKDGKDLHECYEVATSYQSAKFAQLYHQSHYDNGDREKPTVIWLHGSTGTGKTRWAFDNYPNIQNVSYHNGFFQGLRVKHDAVLIDDFRKDFCKFHYLLKILDRYPMTVNIKGGQLWWKPKVIIITCPYDPETVYDTREDVKQLTRRIDHIINCDEIKNISNLIYISGCQ
jgi:hypothetical protein